jgi:hypothetical protein
VKQRHYVLAWVLLTLVNWIGLTIARSQGHPKATNDFLGALSCAAVAVLAIWIWNQLTGEPQNENSRPSNTPHDRLG